MIRLIRNKLNYLAILIHLIGLCIFIFHYLSYTPIPHHEGDFNLNSISKYAEEQIASIEIKCAPSLTKPYVSKLILIIIDALRSTFIPSIQNKSTVVEDYRMPFVEKLMSRGEAIGLVSLAETPTVTMPRIKAIVSGTHPSFIDLIYNLNAAKFGEDNLIERAVNAGKRILFFGDDTWLQMFPADYFVRMNATSSFFATDYTSCDTNVTNSMLPELHRQDEWDMMILHYLGVDHIGHSHGGAKSHLMPDKLLEMDQVIHIVYNALIKSGEESLIVVTGDHGMTEIGNHGGSTREEVETGLLAIPINRAKSTQVRSTIPEIMQIDLAVTLSSILGLATPSKSKGKLCLPVLDTVNMPQDVQLCHLFTNSLHILRSSDVKSCEDSFPLLKKALSLHSSLLKGAKPWSSATISTIIENYSQFISHVQRKLLNERVSHHSIFSFLSLAIAISFSSLLILLYSDEKRTNDAIIAGKALPSLLLYLINSFISTIVKKNRSRSRSGSRNCYDRQDSAHTSITLDGIFLLAHCVLHIVSLSSTSFIEEEQYYWFYISPTYFICRLILIISAYQGMTCSRTDYSRETQVSPGMFAGDSDSGSINHGYSLRSREAKLRRRSRSKTSSRKSIEIQCNPVAQEEGTFNYSSIYLSTLHTNKVKQILQAVIILILLRISASWSQVNIMNPTDIRTLISSKDEKHLLSALVIAVLVLLTFITPSTRISKQHCFLGAGLFWTYLYKSDLGQVASFNSRILAEVGIDFSFTIVTKARLIYFLMVAIFMDGLMQRFKLDTHWLLVEDFIDRYTDPIDVDNRKKKRQTLRNEVTKFSSLRLLATTWVLLSCLLSKCELIPLIGLNVLLEKIVCRFLQSEKIGASKDKIYIKVMQIIITYHMLAMNAFYSMGNSNSTSTIDVAAGFVGLEVYSLTLVSIQVVSSTYCLYIYWIFMLFVRLQESQLAILVRNKVANESTRRSSQPKSSKDNDSQSSVPSSDEIRQLKVKLTSFATLTSCFNFILFIRFACATFYMIVAFILQNHLFIWSVICPKLLYEAFHSFLLTIILFIVSILHILDT